MILEQKKTKASARSPDFGHIVGDGPTFSMALAASTLASMVCLERSLRLLTQQAALAAPSE
jgi:hypothetical protein